MQQLAELGLGQTLRLHIAHAFKMDESGWCFNSKKEIKQYYSLSVKWFLVVALCTIIIIGPAGIYYYHSYQGDIIWEGPWVSLVLVTALTIIITPIQITIESLQHQISVFKAQTYASIINSISLCLLLFSGFGLYAIALSLFISNLIVLIFLWGKIKWLRNNLMPVPVDTNFFVVFKEIWPLFSRVAVVSVFGFLFWNGFNLIAFKVYEPSYAGQVILSITLARAGYGFSESILYGQITYISNLISNKKYNEAMIVYKKNTYIALTILLIGYVFFLLLMYLFPEFYLFKKIVGSSYLISIFVFFIILLFLTSGNNYVRCFKTEPFVKVSIFHGVMVPTLFYLSSVFYEGYYLYPCSLVLIVSLILSKRISNKYFRMSGIN